MVTARGLYWAADFGEIAEAEQFRIGAVDEDLYSAYFPIGQLQDLITVLTNTIPLGIGVLSLGTQVQARKVSTGFHTEVVIEPRLDTFPPPIMRVEFTTLNDLIAVLTSLQALVAGQDPEDWDGSNIKPISYSALPPELSPQALADTIGSAVEANDLGTLAAFPGYTSVGAHVGAPQFSLSNGTDTGCYTRIRHNILGDAQMVRLVYSNWWWRESAAVTDEAGPNAITVRAAIERPDGTKIPVFFNGSRDVVIQPGANAVSDPVAVDVKYDDASAFVYSRNYVTVTSGQKFPLNQYVVTASNAQDQMDIGTSTTDKTLTGTGASAAGQGFGPTIVLGNRPVASRRKPLVAIVGDSIPWGNDDTTTGADAGLKDRGFVNRALETAVIPYVKIAAGGDSPSYFNQFTKSQYRRGLITGSEYAIFYASINRIRLGDSFATVQADALAMWNWLAARGMKVYACTIGPKTTSSNGWTTTGAQTLDTYNANRVLFNDWIRTTPAPLTGYFEVADVMETARNSGIWKVDGAGSYTSDGLHPKTSMHKLMAAAIDTSVLV